MAWNCTGKLTLALFALATAAQADDTVVVYNASYPGSQQLAEHYARARSLPPTHLIPIACPNTDDIGRVDFNTFIRAPLRSALVRKGWWIEGDTAPDKRSDLTSTITASTVRQLVLIRGIPIRITRSELAQLQNQEDEAAVDSELALLGMDQAPIAGRVANPLYAAPDADTIFRKHPALLRIGRLDGPTDALVRRLIDDAVTTEQTGLLGRAVIDLALKDGAYEEGEEWLRQCARLFRQHGIPTYADRQASLIPGGFPLPDTILYFGWYSGGFEGPFADPAFRFAPGAIACHLHSFSAAQLRSATDHWVGPLLARGAAVVAGNVWEPYLTFTLHFDAFTRALLSGATVGEATASATPSLSWMNVVIGDPLYRPFPADARLPLGADGRARDYALFRALAQKHADDPDSTLLAQTIIQTAERRSNPHLLEMLALHLWQSGRTPEAATLLDQTTTAYPNPADQDRVKRYRQQIHP